jgi:hypothetical protein
MALGFNRESGAIMITKLVKCNCGGDAFLWNCQRNDDSSQGNLAAVCKNCGIHYGPLGYSDNDQDEKIKTVTKRWNMAMGKRNLA